MTLKSHTKAGGKVICAQTCVYINAHMSLTGRKETARHWAGLMSLALFFKRI